MTTTPTGADRLLMTVTLNIRTWSARVFDKAITQQAEQDHQVASGTLRVSKRLLPKGAVESYQAIVSSSGAARTEFYKRTLPWDDSGKRLLRASQSWDYIRAMRTHEQVYNDALPVWYAVYPEVREDARTRMNGAFNEKDWPSLREIRRRFKFYASPPEPLADGQAPHFEDPRLGIPQTELDIMRAMYMDDAQARLERAQRDLYDRLYDVVAHMATRLRGAGVPCPCGKCKGVAAKTDTFRDTLVSNIAEEVERIEALNILGDPRLTALAAQVRADLLRDEAGDLRASVILRDNVRAKAQEIQDRMSGLMSWASADTLEEDV